MTSNIKIDQKQTALRTLSLLDLTSLNDNDSEADIKELCNKAISKHGRVAAVCVWPSFVKLAAELLKDTSIKVAAVANFPEGDIDIDACVQSCAEIVKAGGDEVDVVFPYSAFLSGDKDIGAELVAACKQACGNKAKLKVILETGELKSTDLIKQASKIALDNGADFIKTSTGKTPVSATPEAARAMLETLKETDSSAGFKAAGGIKDIETAVEYLALADEIMGEGWVKPEAFRFGASGVLNNLLAVLNNEEIPKSFTQETAERY